LETLKRYQEKSGGKLRAKLNAPIGTISSSK
jgi:hypothetical protein